MSEPSPEFLHWIQEQEASRRRPPGIDEWAHALEARTTAILEALPCYHPHLVGDDQSGCNVGFTYVLQADAGGLVKIGRAQRPAVRARSVQAMSPVRLDVLTVAQGPELERLWHVQFFRQRVHGEWFAPEVAEFFRSHGAPAACVRCAVYGDGKMKPPSRKQRRQAA